MYTIFNDHLQVAVQSKGAELQSIYNKATGIDYLWSGNADFWGKKSPVLFPIVGGLKNNTYTYENKVYQLGRHGFARDHSFEVVQHTTDTITLSLTDTPDTLSVYPFPFTFHLQYQLLQNKLVVTYQIHNTGTTVMPFSVGAHPAFNVPLAPDTVFSDYFLQFNEPETAPLWPLIHDGLIDAHPTPYLQNTAQLPLTEELFYKDALVFKQLKSTQISIKSHKTTHGITLEYQDFPYMGIWSAKNAPFVCIEPWCGIADSVDASGQLLEKEGVHLLEPQAQFVRSWSVLTF
jgi:galactose mutarotase-like enzyme